MRKTLVITDVTEMRGDEVCVAGIDEVGFCVRPMLRGGVRQRHLFSQGRAIVVPGRKVEFNLSDARVAGIKYDRRKMRCDGIRVAMCYGHAVFKRDAEDQDYIETL